MKDQDFLDIPVEVSVAKETTIVTYRGVERLSKFAFLVSDYRSIGILWIEKVGIKAHVFFRKIPHERLFDEEPDYSFSFSRKLNKPPSQKWFMKNLQEVFRRPIVGMPDELPKCHLLN